MGGVCRNVSPCVDSNVLRGNVRERHFSLLQRLRKRFFELGLFGSLSRAFGLGGAFERWLFDDRGRLERGLGLDLRHFGCRLILCRGRVDGVGDDFGFRGDGFIRNSRLGFVLIRIEMAKDRFDGKQ